MKSPLLFKIMTISGLIALLMVPLFFIENIITDRTHYRLSAERDIEKTYADAQVVIAPILLTTVTESYDEEVEYQEKGENKIKTRRVETYWKEPYYPQDLTIESVINPETRYRGIFSVTVFNSQNTFMGNFSWKAPKPIHNNGQIKSMKTHLYFTLNDLRGLGKISPLRWGNDELNWGKAKTAIGGQTIGTEVPQESLIRQSQIAFSFNAEIAGSRSISWVPIAKNNTINVRSSWPHPSFVGNFLPRMRTISANGFNAVWQINALATQAQNQITERVTQKNEKEKIREDLEDLGVSLMTPIDIYQQSARAAKYGVLFLALIFGAFFILEVLKNWQIHPMQYLMVGLAMVLFFLLLLSLAEHWGFGVAYTVATAASVGLIGYYLRYVLGGFGRALLMSALLLLMFGCLFGILQSEDNALLMGTMLLFTVISAAMVATRRLDWRNFYTQPSGNNQN